MRQLEANSSFDPQLFRSHTMLQEKVEPWDKSPFQGVRSLMCILDSKVPWGKGSWTVWRRHQNSGLSFSFNLWADLGLRLQIVFPDLNILICKMGMDPRSLPSLKSFFVKKKKKELYRVIENQCCTSGHRLHCQPHHLQNTAVSTALVRLAVEHVTSLLRPSHSLPDKAEHPVGK